MLKGVRQPRTPRTQDELRIRGPYPAPFVLRPPICTEDSPGRSQVPEPAQAFGASAPPPQAALQGNDVSIGCFHGDGQGVLAFRVPSSQIGPPFQEQAGQPGKGSQGQRAAHPTRAPPFPQPSSPPPFPQPSSPLPLPRVAENGGMVERPPAVVVRLVHIRPVLEEKLTGQKGILQREVASGERRWHL